MIKHGSFILIWMEGLSIINKIIGKGSLAVDDISLCIHSGEYVCISGLYGTDKISFINTVSCLNRPDAGKYLYDYNDTTTIEKAKLDSIRGKTGFLFKNLNVIDELTVYQNIEIPLSTDSKTDKARIISEAADRVGIGNLLHQQTKTLSDLEKHKIALARALAVNPVLIIADEPADSLKQEDTEAVLDLLREVNEQGTAMICFTERKQLIEKAKRYIMFENGKIKSDNNSIGSYVEEGAV